MTFHLQCPHCHFSTRDVREYADQLTALRLFWICPQCGHRWSKTDDLTSSHHEDNAQRALSSPRLSRHERHQWAADHGCDTWEEYRGER